MLTGLNVARQGCPAEVTQQVGFAMCLGLVAQHARVRCQHVHQLFKHDGHFICRMLCQLCDVGHKIRQPLQRRLKDTRTV